MPRFLILALLATGCDPDKTDQGETGDTDDTDVVDTGCPVDVDTAIADLNVVDSGYQSEQIITDFTCEPDGTDIVLTAPTGCYVGDETPDYPFNVAASGLDTADTGAVMDHAAVQILSAKYAQIANRGNPDACDVPAGLQASYAGAGATPTPPPPPTGSCPDLTGMTTCANFQAYNSSSTYTFTNAPYTVPWKLGAAQDNTLPVCGCWIKAAPNNIKNVDDEKLVWLAALYGIVNFGTAATVKFSPCGVGTHTAVISVSKLFVDMPAGDAAAFLNWFDEPATISSGALPPPTSVTVGGIEFSIGGTQYRWVHSKWEVRLPGGKWTPGSEPPGWPSTCASNGPFTIMDGTGPFAIIDPASDLEQAALVTAGDHALNLNFDFSFATE